MQHVPALQNGYVPEYVLVLEVLLCAHSGSSYESHAVSKWRCHPVENAITKNMKWCHHAASHPPVSRTSAHVTSVS